MSQSIDFQLVAALLFAGALAHFALLVATRWLNVLFLICAAFVLASPLSVAIELPGVELFKWARVYLAPLTIIVYFLMYRGIRFGVASWAFLVFLGFYTLAAIWSESMVAGLTFKGMYATVAVAGLLLASSIRSFDDFRSSMRVLSVAALLYGVLTLAGIARDPGSLLSGRLSVWGWNANRVGHDAAAMLVLCLFVGLYDQTKAWKLWGFALASFFGFIVLATGSRAAVGMSGICCVIMAAPLFRRPVLLTTLTIFGGLVLNLLAKSVSSQTTDRLGEVNFSNRSVIWNYGLEIFYENPLVGSGWVFDTTGRAAGASANLHSIYVQLLAETGLVGMILFLLCLLVCGVRAMTLLNMLRRFPSAAPFTFLAFGLGGATLAHGVAESSSLQGTNLNGLLLPFAIGLLDRVPRLITEATADAASEREWQDAVDQEAWDAAEGYGEEPRTA